MSDAMDLANRWHQAIARISGSLALRMGRRKFSRDELEDWATILGTVAHEMKRLSAGEKVTERGFIRPRVINPLEGGRR
jgi:hypothetical protein